MVNSTNIFNSFGVRNTLVSNPVLPVTSYIKWKKKHMNEQINPSLCIYKNFSGFCRLTFFKRFRDLVCDLMPYKRRCLLDCLSIDWLIRVCWFLMNGCSYLDPTYLDCLWLLIGGWVHDICKYDNLLHDHV